MSRCNDENRKQLMRFVLKTPFDEDIIRMDCNDGCDKIARLAERVVAGESIDAIRPELKEHMAHWRDCREEFEALVAVLKAEHSGAIDAFLRELEQLDALRQAKPATDAPAEPETPTDG